MPKKKTVSTAFFKPLEEYKRVYESIPSGSLGLDIVSGNGGWIQHTINRIGGPEGVGKSGLLYKTAANALRMGMKVWWVDTEYSFDLSKMMVELDGFDSTDKMFVNTFDPNAEEPLTIEVISQQASNFFEYNKDKGGSLLVIDSMDNLVTNARLEGDVYDALMGIVPRVLNRWLPMLVSELVECNATAIFVSQARADLKSQYNEYTYNGGYGLRHNAQFFYEVKSRGQLKVGEDIVGRIISGKISKNKAGNNWKTVEYGLRYDIGIDTPGEVIDWLIESGLGRKSGAWIYVDDLKFNGREEMRNWLLDNKDKMREFENRIRAFYNNKPVKQEVLTNSGEQE